MTRSVGEDLSRAVLARLDGCSDARLRTVMGALVSHLHSFVREVDLTPEEWSAAIDFLTATGQACTARRQEFTLLSDTLGVSMLVIALAQARTGDRSNGATDATEASVQGPYCLQGRSDCPLGTDIAEGVRGEPTFYAGRVTDTEGMPIAGALLEVCSGDGTGDTSMPAHGRFRTDDQGRYWFWSVRPAPQTLPADGPVGRLLERVGAHPNRPAHLHMNVSADGFVPLATQLFVAGSDYLDSDAAFGVRDSLIVDFDRHEQGEAPDGRRMRKPYWSAHYDFRLAPVHD